MDSDERNTVIALPGKFFSANMEKKRRLLRLSWSERGQRAKDTQEARILWKFELIQD
jgi:hypothetical protein